MMLTVALRSALEKRYRSDGYSKIRESLTKFSTAVGDTTVVALDDPDDMDPLGIHAVAQADPGTILLTVRALRAASKEPVTALLLIGDDAAIPFWRIANPVPDRQIDPDAVVLTDNPYGSSADTRDQYLAPPLSVGRLADYDGASVEGFCGLIDQAAGNRVARARRSGATAIVNADWFEMSRSAASTLPYSIDWHLAPGYLLNAATQDDANRGYLYFNLHGFANEAEWKGFDSIKGQFVTAVTPDAFDSRCVSGAVAFAENCYGAFIQGKTVANSCALRLLWAGAAVIGATGLAFGSNLAPRLLLQDADFLARTFFAESASGPLELGAALQKARADYLADGGTPATDVYKQKTLLQFILLGDPGWA